jgi:hypothetical protein
VCSGALFGIMYDMSLLVVGATFDTEDFDGIDSYLDMQVSFPTGVDFCGGISCNCSYVVLTEEDTVGKLKVRHLFLFIIIICLGDLRFALFLKTLL